MVASAWNGWCGAMPAPHENRGEAATPMTGQEDVDPFTRERPGVPVGRPGDAREVAAVVTLLASPAAACVTGASWPVDGGMLLTGPAGRRAHLARLAGGAGTR
ncbi:SDR family oxidoreductase [Micromonospora citrea]|uniref:SDR family oxidoreductase n=1 Tax=Micromonospora citrea TaxID=47855 RepID=UPI001FDFC791|nr:SDR family oxidoreductase [Micromonospora citrea]